MRIWGRYGLLHHRGGSGWASLRVEENRALIGHEQPD